MRFSRTALAIGLAGSFALGASQAVAQDKTELRFFTIFDADQVAQWEPVIAAFEEANPDVEVKLETVAGSGAAVYPDVLRTSMVSGDPADLFFMWGGEIAGPFIRADQVRPINDFYEQYNWADRFAPWVVERLTRNGNAYGVPFHARGMAFWYRTDIFENLGLSEPQTYEELEEICVKLKAEGIYCASFGGKFGWHTMRLLDFFAEMECGPDVHDQIFRLEASFDQPCFVQAYALLKKWVDEGWLVPDFLNVSPNDARIPMYLGDAAMMLEGGWMERVLKGAEQDLGMYDFFLPPTNQEPKRYPAFPEQWMITSASKNPEVAARFIDFITSADTQKQFLDTFSGTATAGVKPDCTTNPHDCKWADILSSDVETYGLTDQAYTKELADDFFEVQDGVVAGQYTPEEAGAEMQKRAEAWKADNG